MDAFGKVTASASQATSGKRSRQIRVVFYLSVRLVALVRDAVYRFAHSDSPTRHTTAKRCWSVLTACCMHDKKIVHVVYAKFSDTSSEP